MIPLVHIVTLKCLKETQKYADARGEIEAWHKIVEKVRWHNFTEVRAIFSDADNVDGYVIFNIRKNRYRLVTIIHYVKTMKELKTVGHVYIRSFLTHKEYDKKGNWDRRYGRK